MYNTVVAPFLPRNAMRKRGLCCRPVSCLSVRLSVCLCVTLVDCIHTAEDVVKLLSGPGNTITLVFWPPALVPNSKGNPFSGGAKYTRGRKILRFSTEIAVYLGNGIGYEIVPWLLWNVNSKSCALSNGDIFNDLDGPLTRFSRSRYIWSRIYQKRRVLWTKLLKNTNRKPYPVYRMVLLSMTLIGLWPGFKGRDIFRHWISQKRRETEP